MTAYRFDRQGSQPLSSKMAEKSEDAAAESLEGAPLTAWGTRHELPRRRTGFTLEASVAGHKLFLRTGEHENG